MLYVRDGLPQASLFPEGERDLQIIVTLPLTLTPYLARRGERDLQTIVTSVIKAASFRIVAASWIQS